MKKFCKRCGETKSLKHFYIWPKKNKPDAYCRKCKSAYCYEWACRNREHLNELERKFRADNPELVHARFARYRQKVNDRRALNRDAYNAQQQAWRDANIEMYRKYQREYHKRWEAEQKLKDK